MPLIGPPITYDCLTELTDVLDCTSKIYDIIGPHYEWNWPDWEKHLERHVSSDDEQEIRKRDPGETDDEYKDRMCRRAARPEKRACEEAEWLKSAIIMTRALHFAQSKHTQGYTLKIESITGRLEHSYSPQRMYEYVVVCFNQGWGRRIWKRDLPMPPNTMSEVENGKWFSDKTFSMEQEIVGKWNNGVELGQIVGRRTLSNLAGASSVPFFAYLAGY
ncbi:uncharacterized protein BP5553_01885 [Venustampulla echinocandica]|uniref:Uncharacterized protein n=1 Tax=Venustampulla echinocandica TaxID=2656787 RepID=A0A370U2A3_9HELO|nr:uncharacterized protein BP5553_01885 [Venustampulla echinocandica]RDL41906.1 hypothetical protein BP5553_01885 [Venustampulla echinocandica]